MDKEIAFTLAFVTGFIALVIFAAVYLERTSCLSKVEKFQYQSGEFSVWTGCTVSLNGRTVPLSYALERRIIITPN